MKLSLWQATQSLLAAPGGIAMVTHAFDKLPIRVLIVEDDRDYAEMLRVNLDSNVLKIVGVAYDGRTALAMWNELECGALITDLKLGPPYDGPDVIREVRQMTPDAIVVALTGTEDEELAREAALAGAQAVFRKAEYPPIREEITSAITERNGVTYT